MSWMLSYCGLNCYSCQIYLMTREKDLGKKEKMISEIIQKCRTLYRINFRYEEINDCDGCKSVSGRLFSGCTNCKIRRCVIEKEIENCAFCNVYPCNTLNDLLKVDPCVKTRLDIIRSSNM